MPYHTHIIVKTDVIKYMMSRPIMTGRIGKWILALKVASIPETLKVASIWFPPSEGNSGKEVWIQQEIKRISSLWITPWKLHFDGSCTQQATGSGIVIASPHGAHYCYSFLLDYDNITNNIPEYEALIIGLEILIELRAGEKEVIGDSELSD